MQVVSQRAMQMADQATAMANRGMLYSAQTELIQSLAMIAQALDVQTGASRHGTALNAGMMALSEAREFAATNVRGGEPVNIGAIAAGHRTPVLRSHTGTELSPVVAQQQYFGYAQNQLAVAAGNVAAGSQILYRLGRLQTAMAAHDTDPQALREPQAIVFHQAALATDRGNWLAANELGVLYARYGQLAEARQLLIHSVTVHSNLEGWHNLSVVHRRLGEADLAQKASTEWQLLAKQTGKTRSDGTEMVRWVDPQTFAASHAADARWPASTAARPIAAAQGSVRR
jgi:tetratricopeptide (TPR) repeat protein